MEFVIVIHITMIYQKWKSKLNNENNLELILDKIRSRKNKDYDYIIGVSGGIDSSFNYLAKDKFKLRPLIFHVDAGWNSQIAVENIGKLLDHLDLDYSPSVDWEEVRDLQISFLNLAFPY